MVVLAPKLGIKENRLDSMPGGCDSLFKGYFATFLQVHFVCLKESTSETRKKIIYFTSIAFFILEINLIFAGIQMS